MKQIKLVKQRDRSDCGAACMASVSAYFGMSVSVSRIRMNAGTDKAGTSLQGMMKAAGALNLESRAVRVRDIPVTDIPLPAIFHLTLENRFQHFVVVYEITNSRIRFMDPSKGELIFESITEFGTKWKGIIILLRPTKDFERKIEKRTIWKRFLHLMMPHRSILFLAFTNALLYTIVGLATSVYIQKIIDSVIPQHNHHLLNALSIGIFLLLVVQALAGYLKSRIALGTGQKIDAQLILGYYDHMLGLPKRFFDNMQTGEIVSRVNDAVRIRSFINDTAMSLLVHALTILFSVAGMFIYSARLAWIMLATIPLYMFIYRVGNQIHSKWQRRIMQNAASVESHLVETIQGVSTIRRFGAEGFFSRKMKSLFTLLMKSFYKSSLGALEISIAGEWLMGFSKMFVLWAGASLVIKQTLTEGELISFFTLIVFFSLPMQVLIGANKQMQDALIAADRLFEITDLGRETEYNETVSQVDFFPLGDICFRNISFSYCSGNTVFSGLDLHIPRNKLTAIVGESGSGKSTILSLLHQFYSPDEGNILIGDIDIRRLPGHILRRQIAAVPQQTDLFRASITANIALGENEPDLQRICYLSRLLGLHDFINQLPEKYDTKIAEQGINLSGGQKQKISMARALYRDPEVLVLDEATSAMDPENESRVLETIRWFLNENKTVIVIAHRLSTIRTCESILFLRDGKCAASGSHEKLMEENPEYASFWRTKV